MRCYVLFAILPMFMTGCVSSMTLEDKALRTHVVDACFTVQEQAPLDASERIDKYLQKYMKNKELSEQEVYMLKASLERSKKK